MNLFRLQTRAYLVPSCHGDQRSVRFCASRASVAVTVSRCGSSVIRHQWFDPSIRQ